MQPAILSHTSAKTCKTLQKSNLWSLLKDLNNELRDKQYLIEVNNEILLLKYFIIQMFIVYATFFFRNVVTYHQQIFLFG